MNESERSEAYGTSHESGMSSDDAAELEELRREAALLREQLENAVGPQSGLRSARDVHQLEARIDSLASRNAKLMETLKEARQQLLAELARSGGQQINNPINRPDQPGGSPASRVPCQSAGLDYSSQRSRRLRQLPHTDVSNTDTR